MDLFKESIKAGDGNDYKSIYYIGRKAEYVDHLYKTGIWLAGKVKAVAPVTAFKLLRHPDLFSTTNPAPEADAAEEDGKSEEVIDDPSSDATDVEREKAQVKIDAIRVEVEGMTDPEQLRQYSRERLRGWGPDKRFVDPVKLRQAINQHAQIAGWAGLS